MKLKGQTVSELVSSIKNLLEGEFRHIIVSGEVSNLTKSSAGHWYFSLSDKDSTISCALFKMDALRNPLIKKIKNGDEIIINGPISVYAKRGSFQILAKRIVVAGQGELALKFQILKEKLAQEGLFDVEYKKSIPKFPKKVAVITALQGAALQDFLNIMQRRSLWFQIVIIPTTVQGDKSAQDIVKSIEKAENVDAVECIVLTRGGGAIEDLWSFNEEVVVRKIAECEIPVISAIGHQTDFTLSDYASDLRCETPSAAAEVLSQVQVELEDRLSLKAHRLLGWGQSLVTSMRKRLELVHPNNMLLKVQATLNFSKQKFNRFNLTERFYELTNIYQHNQFLDEAVYRMDSVIKQKLSQEKQKLDSFGRILSSVNPRNVLKRGYSFVEVGEQKVITSVEKFNKIDEKQDIRIHFHDGDGLVRKVK